MTLHLKYDINFALIIALFLLLSAACGFSILSYWAVEEGNDSKLLYIAGTAFYGFRFPTHNIIWNWINEMSSGWFMVTFGFGLMINNLIYALAIERFIRILKKIKTGYNN